MSAGRCRARRSSCVSRSSSGRAVTITASAWESTLNCTSGESDWSETYSRPSCCSRAPRSPRRPARSRSWIATSASAMPSVPRRRTSVASCGASLTISSRNARWSSAGCASAPSETARASAGAHLRAAGAPLRTSGPARPCGRLQRLLQRLVAVGLHGGDQLADPRARVAWDVALEVLASAGQDVPAWRLPLEEPRPIRGESFQPDRVHPEMHVAVVLQIECGRSGGERYRREPLRFEYFGGLDEDGDSNPGEHAHGGARLRRPFRRRELLDEQAVRPLERAEGNGGADPHLVRLAGLEREQRGVEDDVPGRTERHAFLRVLAPGVDLKLEADRFLSLVPERQEGLALVGLEVELDGRDVQSRPLRAHGR